jgi:membrane protease YdiL (CAAX protease family)
MRKKYVVFSSLISCILLYYIEQVLQTNYFIKTGSKLLLFILVPLIYIKFIKKVTFKEALNFNKIDKQHLKLGFIFGLASFFVVLTAYFVLRNFIDLQGIAAEMQNKSKITPANFLFVGAYVTFGNSFLEEYFFRGFVFLSLYELNYKRMAYVYSSLLFGLYHMAIFKNWFNPALIGLALFGLIFIGFVFDWLNTKSENFLNSWLVHILADSAIIIIGLRMFNMI